MPRERDKTDKELYGEGLLGDSLAPVKSSELARKFQVPPFTVLNAREGWWQDRKRAWLSLGIQSELGRGNEGDYNAAAPGGSAMPAMNYKNRERGTGTGTGAAIPGSAAPTHSVPTIKVASAPPPFVQAPAVKEIATALRMPQVTVVKAPEPRSAPAIPKFTYSDPFMNSIRQRIGDGPVQFDAGWNYNDQSPVGVDVECYKNFFLICAKRFADGKMLMFERSDRTDFDTTAVGKLLSSNRIVTFNGAAYDLPLIYLALRGSSPADLKLVSDRIIKTGIKPWDVEREFGVQVPRLDHIDMLESNPSVRSGLKLLYGRLHGRFLVDLPFDETSILTPEQMNVAILYCANDLDATQKLWEALLEPIELRRALSNQYHYDLRSKSDAQIGEFIVKRRVEHVTGRKIVRSQNYSAAQSFRYKIPSFIQFKDERMQSFLTLLESTDFIVDGAGHPQMPILLNGLEVTFGSMVYSMGIGGLHSTEAHRAVRSDDDRVLIDVDVASQYPSIIAKLGMHPQATGPEFIGVYSSMIKERLEAKAVGDKVRADGGKIALNGVYGKLGSPYSALYAPDIMIAVTLTGQLSILMLIERCENAGIPVMSANTDGAVLYPRRVDETALDSILAAWETDTGFKVERTRYAALYSSSVNTYLALREDGKVKRKGAIADPWSDNDLRGQLSKNPQMTILSEACMRLARDGVGLEETIRNATDPRQFVTVVRVTGGAVWRGHPLGRVVRYYWSLDGDPILYANGDRRVAKTEGARPMMEMTDALPPDIDYLRYYDEATRLAEDLGITGPLGGTAK